MKTAKRIIPFFYLFILISCKSNSLEPINIQTASNFEWAKSFVSTGQILGSTPVIAVDSHGNSFVSGIFMNTTKFDSVEIKNASANVTYYFLAKYDSNGKVVWVKWAPNTEVKIYDLSIDLSDNLLITGTFNPNTKFFSDAGLNQKSSLIKLNKEGNLVWSIFTSDFARMHKTDNLNNIFQIAFQTGDLLHFYKITSSGNVIYSKSLVVSGQLAVRSMVISNDALYLSGQSPNKVDFGNISMTSPAIGTFYLVKFDLNGNCLWAINTIYDSAGNRITYDNTNNRIIVFGHYDEGFIKLENIILGTGLQMRTMFIASYNSDGKIIWAKDLKASPTTLGGLGSDKYGNIYLTNGLYETLDLGKSILQSSTGEIFIAKLNLNGELIWVEKTNNTVAAFPWDMKIGDDGNTYLTGNFQQQISFGKNTLYGYGFFIAKYVNH